MYQDYTNLHEEVFTLRGVDTRGRFPAAIFHKEQLLLEKIHFQMEDKTIFHKLSPMKVLTLVLLNKLRCPTHF